MYNFETDYLDWLNEMANMQLNTPLAFQYAVEHMSDEERSCLIGEGILAS